MVGEMRQTFDVQFAQNTQSFLFVAPEGRPATATIKVVKNDESDDAADVGLFGTSANVEADPNTTLSSILAIGDTYVQLNSVAGIVVGGMYRLASLLLEHEMVIVTKIAVGGVYVRHPVLNAYTTGTFVSTRLSLTTSNVFVADTANLSGEDPNPKYRGSISYNVGAATHKHYFYADLVRMVPKHHVQPSDLEDHSPNWILNLPTYFRRESGRPLIDRAYQDVKFDLEASELDDASLRNDEMVDELVLFKTLHLTAMGKEMNKGGTERATDMAMKAYEYRLNSLVRLHRVIAVDTGTTGAGGPTRAMQLTVR